jgi:hypothetical protein
VFLTTGRALLRLTKEFSYIFWAVSLPLAAQSKIQFGLTPAMVVQEFKPGEPFAVELEVTNGNAAPVPMRGLAMDFWYDDKNKNVFGPPGTYSQSASNWLEFVPPQIVVPANGSAKIRLVVTPPLKAEGSFYSVAFLESRPELTEPARDGRKALYTNIRLGTLLLFAAEKTQKYLVELSDVKITPPSAETAFSLDLQLSNLSNTHIFPRPALLILDKESRVVAKAQGEIKRFMPGEHKGLSIPWSGRLKSGDYEAILTLVYADDRTVTKRVPFGVSDADAMAKPPDGAHPDKAAPLASAQ